LPYKQNLEAGLMWKMTLSVHYHALSLEHLCFLEQTGCSLLIDYSTCCVFKLFLFLLCACVTVVAVEKFYSQWAMDPLLFGHMLKTVENPCCKH